MSLIDRTPKEIRDSITPAAMPLDTDIVHVSKTDNESEGLLLADVARLKTSISVVDETRAYILNDYALHPDDNRLIFANQTVPIETFDPDKWNDAQGLFTDYKVRADIRIDSTEVQGSHTDFEIRIAKTITGFIGKSETTPKGDDIIFAQDDKILPFEIDDYDDTTGIIHATFLGDVDDITDKDFQVYIGNPNAISLQNPQKVWQKYLARYGMQDCPTTTTIVKDSKRDFDGAFPGGTNNPALVTSDNAISKKMMKFAIPASATLKEFIDITPALKAQLATSDQAHIITVIKRLDPTPQSDDPAGSIINWTSDEGVVAARDVEHDYSITGQIRSKIQAASAQSGAGFIPQGTFVVTNFDYDGANVRAYSDGILRATAAKTGNIPNTLPNVPIKLGAGGTNPPLANDVRFNGNMYEIRVLQESLFTDDDYIKTVNNSLKNTTTFVVVDSVVDNEFPIQRRSLPTIEELSDVSITDKQSDDVAAFDVPANQWINKPRYGQNAKGYSSMAELTEEFGENLEILTNTSRTIFFEKTFTLTKGFKRQSGASIFLTASSESIMPLYQPDTVGEPLISDIDPDNPGAVAVLQNGFRMTSLDNTAPVFDAANNLTARGGIEDKVLLIGFESFGRLFNFASANLLDCNLINFVNGGIIEDCTVVNVLAAGDNNVLAAKTGRVFLNIRASSGFVSIVNVSRALAITKIGEAAIALAGSFNLNAATRFEVDNFNVQGVGDLYSPNEEGNITSVTDDAGDAVFNTSAPHGMKLGDMVSHRDFAESTYNGTFTISSAPTSTSYTIGVVSFVADDTGEFFRVEHFIDSVTDDGNGFAQFNTLVTPEVDEVVNLFSNPTYNQLVKVLSVDPDVSFVTNLLFDVNAQPFWTRGSRDETDPQINSVNNPDQPDSMTIAEERQGNTITVDQSGGGSVAVENSPPVDGDFIEDVATERFTINTSTGLITYTGLETINAFITLIYTVAKVGGGSDDYEVVLTQNASPIAKTLETFTSLTTTPTSLTYSGIHTINPTDTIQLFSENTSGTANLTVTNLKLIIVRQ